MHFPTVWKTVVSSVFSLILHYCFLLDWELPSNWEYRRHIHSQNGRAPLPLFQLNEQGCSFILVSFRPQTKFVSLLVCTSFTVLFFGRVSLSFVLSKVILEMLHRMWKLKKLKMYLFNWFHRFEHFSAVGVIVFLTVRHNSSCLISFKWWQNNICSIFWSFSSEYNSIPGLIFEKQMAA